MKLTNQEKSFKQKMQSFEAEVNTSALWEALEDQVPKKRRKWLPFIFIISLAVTLVSISAIILNQNSNGENILVPASANLPAIEGTKTINEQINKIETNKDQTQIIRKTLNDLPNEKVIQTLTQNNTTSKTEITVLNAFSSNEKNNINPDEQASRFPNTSNDPIQNIEKTDQQRPLFEVSKMQALNAQLFNKNIQKIDLPRELTRENKVRRHLFSTALVFGSGVGKIDFSSEYEENKEHAAYLSSISTLKPIINAGFSLNYSFMDRLYISSGIDFSRLVTKYHPSWTRTTEESSISLSGLPQSLIREQNYEAIGHNYHYLLDIPLKIGVEIIKTKKVILSLETGISYNAYHLSKGYYLDNNRQIKLYDSNNSSPYNSRFNTAWKSALILNYRLGQKVLMNLNANYHSKNIDFKTDKLTLEENYKIALINLGLQYDL